MVSKKGTKAVTATNLFQALELPKAQYSKIVKGWLSDIYQFPDGIRRPVRNEDFSRRSLKNSVVDDYYLTVELAKMITLNSRSRVKQKYAKYLCSLEDQVENAELLTKEQVFTMMELARVMGLVSCQTASEKRHQLVYEQRNNGNSSNWWNFRRELLGYGNDDLRHKLELQGKNPKSKSQREMLMQLDKYEMIRTAIIDLFMGMGKTERYAKNLGDLAKRFAAELQVEIFDDRNGLSAFAPEVNVDLAREVKASKTGKIHQLWSVETANPVHAVA